MAPESKPRDPKVEAQLLKGIADAWRSPASTKALRKIGFQIQDVR